MTDNAKHPTGGLYHHHHHHHDHHVAPECDDQIPVFSSMGRGPHGDSAYIDIQNGRVDTHLIAKSIDGVTGMMSTEWISDNINGGELRYQYNLNPHTIPRTFTITFVYTRGHEGDENYASWSWTTPAIPYIWRIDADGVPEEDPDAVIGTGVATLFVRTTHGDKWNERLHYPIDPTTGQPYDRSVFNAPEAEEPWSATITFGFGGDIEIPDFDDLAKIIGCTKEDIFNILQDNSVHWDGIDADNLLDYINKCDKRDRDHFHKDLGFNSEGHPGTGAFGGENTVKEYIDKKIKGMEVHINNLYGLIDDLLNHVYGVTTATIDLDDATNKTIPEGKGIKVNWNPDAKIPQGNINLFSGDVTHYIRTRSGENNDDLKGV